jgi:hypothetical protein
MSTWVFHPLPSILKNTFQKLDVCPLVKGWEAPTLLGPLERANLNHWTNHLRIETGPVSGMFCRINNVEKSSKLSNPKHSIPWSETTESK